MSDYEKLNQRAAAQKVVRRKEALKKLCLLLAIVAAVLLAFWGLEYIGFISDLFFVILVLIAVCVGFFNAGRLWEISK
ncbi:MAG: hypothetical protein IKK41_03355 [Oscillospiraceae bacterium]|nr:hypothetical protein [Oscillospiraceae bacterium]